MDNYEEMSLEELEALKATRAKKKIADEKKELEDRIEALEKQKGIKKSIEQKVDDDDDKNKKDLKKDEDEVEDLYPSVYVPGIPEKE